ncbi:MAG: nitrate reductase subunit alpha [Hyphomicrobiaceae bacterium]|nr:nitrate reductase subunit alpha [Hyphomicrobiaceae bacterium]
MSQFVDRLLFFRKYTGSFAGGHGVVTNENRAWEDNYRTRWQHDKIVRSTHGVNCTGSCSWKIYVKNGLITWETQQTDYPRTRPDLPDHEPRGCPRGASYSWYIYSSNRIKYPLIRGRLLQMWRDARVTLPPVEAWASIVESPERVLNYKSVRGLGGFVRGEWDEINELIAAANVYTVRTWGPDRVAGFSPIPAMSMVSYAAGTRYLSLIGGTCLSFYDWYCDLPPSSPQTWGEQTDVPESADWYNAGFLLVWGSNISMTRSPDTHFYTEARYRGQKSVVIAPDFIECAKFADLWLAPKQGTDAALALAMGHVILKEFYCDKSTPYFDDYARRFTDLPLLVRLERRGETYVPGRLVRASDFADRLGQETNPEWKTVGLDQSTDEVVVPQGSIGFRWGEHGRWNLEEKEGRDGRPIRLRLTLKDAADSAPVAFPYFGSRAPGRFGLSDHADVQVRNVPARKLALADGETLVVTVFDLMLGSYGVDRGLGGDVASTYDDNVPFTPAWAEAITGLPRQKIIDTARGFAVNAEATEGRSMVVLGAGLNHWYHMDMTYRGIINLLVLCGCVGKSGGGWAHYVGQEKLRPAAGWFPLAFATDWSRPPRLMNGTSFMYAHTDQWRYERLKVSELLSPLADPDDFKGTFIDCNVRAERMGWLPSSPQLADNPLKVCRDARAAGQDPVAYTVEALKSGRLTMACEDPDDPRNFPRNLFVWRANLLGASGKGHEYFLKHLMGARNNVLNEEIGASDRPVEVVWHDQAPEGKLDLLVTIDFRMNTTCLFSDIVLPTATWYEKNDLNTSDMHPFIHPLTNAVDPVWEARSDFAIFKGFAECFTQVAGGVLGEEEDIVLTPAMHDSPGELAQPFGGTDWRRGGEAVPGRTMPAITIVNRDYTAIDQKFKSVGPLLERNGNALKGIQWSTEEEVELLRDLNLTQRNGAGAGQPRLESDIHFIESILTLAPETNGRVAVKAWHALEKSTGREHTHLALHREDEQLRFRDLVAQPRKIITSPTWSGIESEKVSYNAGWTNVHELIPWRTLSGRQQLYQDHPWMRAFGEFLVTYKPPINTRSLDDVMDRYDNGNPQIVLNFLTPHQKWGIHSTYTENLIMLTLARGGPIVWISEKDARKAGLEDNDWIEAYNLNGALVARTVVSQRIPEGAAFMYHAAERMANVPGSEITGNRGGIHNSVTRIVMKPTHMVGGYAQLSYGFNYYGTVGSNRDEFIVLRKVRVLDWRDRPLSEKRPYMAEELRE